MNYLKHKCPVCKQKFTENDDIVVCPMCGTPHHRECYNKLGDCSLRNKHDENYDWKKAHDVDDVIVCPLCAHKNPNGLEYCQKCGLSLVNDQKVRPEFTPPYKFSNIFRSIMGTSYSEEIDGVSMEDIAKFVKTNPFYYATVFKSINEGRGGRFNFCAFLFTGGWMLFRKQYKYGSIVAFIVAFLMVVSTYVSYTFNIPLIEDILNTAGVSSLDVFFTSQQMQIITQQLSLLPFENLMLLLLPTVFTLIKWTVMFILGFKGNKIYMKHCISKIKDIKNTSVNQTQYLEKLNTSGGVNFPLAFCLFICYVIISWLPQFLM